MINTVIPDFRWMNSGLEKWLFEKGFKEAAVRIMVRNQLWLTAASVLFTAAFYWAGLWPVYYLVGVLLATYNFFSLARFIQQVVHYHFTRALLVSLLVRVYGRLLLTGLVLVVMIGWLKAPVEALLIGLSTVVATILFWGGSYVFEQKVKEA